MAIRHMVFATFFIIAFGMGMVNVMTDGRLAHEIRSELPNHAGDGNVSIENVDAVNLEPGEDKMKTVEVQNAKRISYMTPDQNTSNSVDLDISLQPPVSGVEKSMPPHYIYSHQEKSAQVRLNFSADPEAKSGNLTFQLTAKPGDIDSRETAREIPVMVQ